MSVTRPARAAALAVSLVAAAAAAATAPAVAQTPAGVAAALEPQQQIHAGLEPYRSLGGSLLEDGGAAITWGNFSSYLLFGATGRPFAPLPARFDATNNHVVGIGPRGGGLLAWDIRGRTRAVRLGATGPVGGELAIDGFGWPQRAEINDRGDALVVMIGRRYGLSVAQSPSRRGAFLPLQKLGDPPGSWAPLIPLRTGFVAAWIESRPCRPDLGPDCARHVLRAAVARDGRRFGPTRTIGAAERLAETGTEATLRLLPHDGDGALLAWTGRDGSRGVHVATLAPGARRFGRAQRLSTPDVPVRSLEAAANERGDALVVWSEPDRARGGSGSLRLATRSPDGGWRSSRTLSDAATDARWPRVRLGARGDALVAWSGDGRWWLRTRPAGGSMTAAVEMPTIAQPWTAGLGVDPRGSAYALFETTDRAITAAHDEGIAAAVWPVGQQPRPRLLDHGPHTVPQLAVNDRGQALATWASWVGSAQIHATVRSPGSDFSPPQVAASHLFTLPTPYVNRRGDLLIVSQGRNEEDEWMIGAVHGSMRATVTGARPSGRGRSAAGRAASLPPRCASSLACSP
jgi:hypothetical protein